MARNYSDGRAIEITLFYRDKVVKIINENFILQKTSFQPQGKLANKTLSKAFFNDKTERDKRWTIWHIGTGVGLLGGLFMLAFATFLTVFQFLFSENPRGSWLYAIVLPLWVLGAHCFDKIEDIDKAKKNDYRI
jgi:hypothetical protein